MTISRQADKLCRAAQGNPVAPLIKRTKGNAPPRKWRRIILLILFQQIIDRDGKKFRQFQKVIQIGFAAAALPKADRLIAHAEQLPQGALRKSLLGPKFLQFFSENISRHKNILLQNVGNHLTSYVL